MLKLTFLLASLFVIIEIGAQTIAETKKDSTKIGATKYDEEIIDPKFSALESITASDLKQYLIKLTSDELAGRETGKPGQKLAAQYLSEKMKEFGLTAGNDTSFFQVFTVNEFKPAGELVFNGEKNNFLKEFYFLPGVLDTVINTNEILFCGYGIDDPKYSDYKNVDVKGKVILILEGEPKGKDGKYLISGEEKPSDWAHDIRRKSSTAKNKGALAVIYFSISFSKAKSAYYHFIEKPTMVLKDAKQSDDKERKRMNFYYIGDTLLNQLLGKNSAAKKELAKLINNSLAPKKYPVIKGELKIEIKRIPSEVQTENVIGVIEGTDKNEEAIIITAHYDHLGKQGNDIYYGADDDGSGTAAILEIGQAFMRAAASGKRPRRTIIIMPVSGEEKGLLGSMYYTLHPTFPLTQIVADLNIDMIGRRDEKYADNPNYVYAIGSDKLSNELKTISDSISKTDEIKLELDYMYDDPNDPNKFYYRSDHYNFAKNNIPVIFYFSGVHADYHKPTDTIDKIEFDKMEKITRLVFLTAWELANMPNRLKLKE